MRAAIRQLQQSMGGSARYLRLMPTLSYLDVIVLIIER